MSIAQMMADHVVLIGIDGMGGYYIDKKIQDGTLSSLCPTFADLLNGCLEGFETVIGATNGRTVFPPVSAPAWASILSGLTPDQTGVDTKEWPLQDVDAETGEALQMKPVVSSPENATIPRSLFDMVPLASSARSVSGSGEGGQTQRHLSIVGWDWLGARLSGPLSSAVETILWEPEGRRLANGTLRGVDDDVVDEFVKRFSPTSSSTSGASTTSTPKVLPRFSFLHFDEVDHAGHQHSWGSDEYYASWLVADRQLKRVLDALRDKSAIVVVLADHGGSEKGHGVTKSSHMMIPFILAGTNSCPKMASSVASSESSLGSSAVVAASLPKTHSSLNISAIDVAPTILKLQGVDVSGDLFLRGKSLAKYV